LPYTLWDVVGQKTVLSGIVEFSTEFVFSPSFLETESGKREEAQSPAL
jgi:hypothetical protein